MRLVIIILAVLSFLSCREEKFPADILPPEKMEAVFFDYLQVDVFTKDFIAKDSSKNPVLENAALQNKVFEKYNISKETFYKSYEYYAKDEVLMRALLDSISVHQRVRTKDNFQLNKIKLDEKDL